MNHALIVAIYVGLTLLVIGLCYLLGMFNMRGKQRAYRYKLGERWETGPLWFVGKPKESTTAHSGLRELTSGAPVDRAAPTVVGGASGTW